MGWEKFETWYNNKWGYKSGRYISVLEIIILSVVGIISTVVLFAGGFRFLFIKQEIMKGVLVSGLPTLLLLESFMLRNRSKAKKGWIFFLSGSILVHIVFIIITLTNPLNSISSVIFIFVNDATMVISRLIANAVGGTKNFKKSGPLELVLEGLITWEITLMAIFAALYLLSFFVVPAIKTLFTTHTSKDYKDSKSYKIHDNMSDLIDSGEHFDLTWVEDGPASSYSATAKFKYRTFLCEFDYVDKIIKTPAGIEYEYIYEGPDSFKVGNRMNYLEKE